MVNQEDKENLNDLVRIATTTKNNHSNILQCNQNILNQNKIFNGCEKVESDINKCKIAKVVQPSLTPQKQALKNEPVTPTTNLKILVSAASVLTPADESLQKQTANFSQNFNGDIQDKKNAISTSDMFNASPKFVEAKFSTGVTSETDISAGVTSIETEINTGFYSEKPKMLQGRKEKSLGLLCKRFLSIYPEFSSSGTTIMLDDVVRSLNIGRRRVYDIVNVLESMEMIVRQAKNRYLWFGKSRLPATLTKLKALALKVYGKSVTTVKKVSPTFALTATQINEINGYIKIAPKPLTTISNGGDATTLLLTIPITQNPCLKENNDLKTPILVDDKTNSIMEDIISNDQLKKEPNRSLGILCQKFIMLFMVTEGGILSLDCAAKILFKDNDDGPVKSKTKVRRLYDIANILTSINFLEKCQGGEGTSKRAAYKWIGFDLDQLNSVTATKQAFESQDQCTTRHSLLSQAEKKKNSVTRKLHSRSLSAHQLMSKDVKDECEPSKFPRTVSACTKLTANSKDGFDIDTDDNELDMGDALQKKRQQVEKESANESPNQILFKKKLNKLRKEFPEKFTSNGILDMISDGKTDNFRRRLTGEFPCTDEPTTKKRKVRENADNADPTSVECSLPSKIVSKKSPSESTAESTLPSVENAKENVQVENVKSPVVNNTALSYLAIPTTFKSVGVGPNGFVTPFVLAEVGMNTSSMKQGRVLQVLPMLQQGANGSNNGVVLKLHQKPNNVTMHPNLKVLLANPNRKECQSADTTVAYITPPHVNSVCPTKPAASPIIFPKMAPETPTATSSIPASLLNTVTRKLMS